MEKGAEKIAVEEKRTAYKTGGYNAVLAYVREHRDVHIEAQAVYHDLRMRGNALGQATVYRQLQRLTDEGVLEKLPLAEGKGACYRYVGDCKGTHYHLYCTVCGGLTHLDCAHFAELYRHVGEEHGFRIDGARTVFYGTCAICAGKPVEVDKR